MELDTKSHPGWVVQTVTVSEALDLIHKPAPAINSHSDEETARANNPGDHRHRWAGVDCGDLLAAKDWPKGRELVAKYSCQLAGLPQATSIVRRRRWSEDGDEFSRDRLDAGYAECWSSRKRVTQQRESGVLKLTVNIGGSASHPAHELAWIGAAACVLVDRLEDAGYRVEFEVVSGSDRMYATLNRKNLLVMPVKRAGDPLDLDTALMACSSPWFFRVHLFRVWCEQPWEVTTGKGYLEPAPAWAKGDIHLEAVYSLTDAQAQLGEILKRFGKEGDMQCVA